MRSRPFYPGMMAPFQQPKSSSKFCALRKKPTLQKKPRSRGATRVDDGLVPFASTTVRSPRLQRRSSIQCQIFVRGVLEQRFGCAEMLVSMLPPPWPSPASQGREFIFPVRSRVSVNPTVFTSRRASECLRGRRGARRSRGAAKQKHSVLVSRT